MDTTVDAALSGGQATHCPAHHVGVVDVEHNRRRQPPSFHQDALTFAEAARIHHQTSWHIPRTHNTLL